MNDARTESVLPHQSAERVRPTACWPAWKHGTIAALLTGLVVFQDVTWPSLSIFYFLPTLYVAWTMRGRAEWILYGALTVTVFLAPLLGAPNRVSAKGTLNRTLGASTGLFMAYLIWHRRRFAEHLQRSNEQLEARVEERSAELNATIDRLRQSEQGLRQHLAELTVLNRMGVICSEVSTEDELLHRATTLIAETLFPDNCGFLLLDAVRGVLVTHPSFVLSDPTVSRADKALGTGITGQVALTGHARRVGDVSQEPGYLAADSSTRSELCIPMQIGSKVVGVLNVESRKPNAFSDIDEQLASTIVGLVSNALERLRAESQVRQSQQFLRSITLAFPNWVYIFDFDTQGITYTNRSILGDLGHSSEAHNAERSLEQFAEYMPPEERLHLVRVLGDWQALADGQLRDDEYQLCHADGTTHSFVGREIVFTRRPDGSVRQVLGTLADITTRRQAEAATQLSEQHFALFMQHLPGLAWIKDDQGRYVFANAAAEQAFGISLSLLFGKTDDEIFPPETAAQFQAADRQALASGTEVRTVETLEHEDGILHHAIVSKFSLPSSDGQALLVGGMAIDITEHKQAEEKLRQSEASLAEAQRVGHIGSWELDLVQNQAAWSEECYRLLGLTPGELAASQHVFMQRVHPDDREMVRAVLAHAIGTRTLLDNEFRFLMPDGQTRWLHSRGSAVYDPDGRAVRFVGLSQDVTARKLAEATIRQSAAFRETIIQTAAEGICVCSPIPDFPQVAFSVWNDQMTELTGYTMDEINRLGWYQTMYPDPDMQQRAIDRMAAMRDGNDMRAEEWEITRKDGARRTLSISTSLVETDTNIHGVVALMQDVTERKQAIVELRQSEARYRQLVENSPYCIHELDAEGRFLSMNAAGLRMMGQNDPACIRGSHYLDAVSAADRPLIAQRLDAAMAGTSSFFEFTAVNGRFFSSSFVPLSGGTTMGITQDITERRRAAEALHESEARYRLIAELASSFSYQAKLTVDDQVALQWVGGKFQEVTGYQPDELDGPGWFALIPQEDLPRILEQVAGLRSPETDLSEAMEVRIRTRAGELRWIRSVVHVESPAKLGDPITVYGAVLDITERKRAEEALEMMRFSVDHAGDSVFWVSRTGHILYVNDAACAGRGFSRDELLSMTVFDLDPDFQPAVWNPHFEDLRNHGTLTFETRHRAKDGRVFPIEVNANYVHIGDQEFNFASVRDITERRRQEALLRGQNQVLGMIAANAPLTETLAALLRHIEAQSSEMLCSILLLDADGQHLRHGAAPSLPEEYTQAIDGVGIGPCVGSCGTAAFRREAVIVEDIENDPLWADYRGVALPHGLRACWSTPVIGEQNRVLGTFAIYYRQPGSPTEQHLQLITVATQSAAIAIRQSREQAVLRESEERFRLLFEGANDAIFWADAETGLLSHCNLAAENLLGRERAEIIGQPQAFLHPPEETDRYRELFRAHASSKSKEPIEVEVIRKDGRRVDVSIAPSVTAIGSQRVIQGIFRDITERKRAEAALRESEDRFQAFMTQSPVVAWAKDEEFRFRYVNAAFEKLFNMPASQILGRMDYELYPQEYSDNTRANDLQVRNSRQILDTIECVPGADGRPRQWLVQKFPLHRSGQPLWVGGTAVDVTARLEAEAASRESERRLNFALEMSQIGAWGLNLQDHTAYRTLLHDRIFGYETLLPNWTYEMFLEHVLPEDRPTVDQGFHEAIAKQTDWNFECRIRRVDGEVRWIWAAGGHEQPLVGEPTRMSGIVRDITQRKLVQEELRRSQKQFQQLFQSSPLATLLYSATDDRIADANLRFLEMFQFRLEEVLGRTGPELGLWCDLAARDRLIDHLQRDKEVRNFEVRLRSKEGHEYDLLLSSQVIELPAGPMVLAQANDITERKQTQVALTLFRTLLDHCNDGFEVIDPDTGRFLDVNDKACWSHGYSREEYLALSVPEIDPLVGERPWEETRQELYRRGFAILDTLHRRKDGSVFPVEVNFSFIRLDRDYFLAVVRDITERKRAAEALRQSEEQYRGILETLPVGVLIHDGQQMHYANPKAAQILGVRHAEELSRIDPMGIVAPEYRELARGRVETMLRTGHSLPPIEAVVLRVDGLRVNVEVNSRPTHFAGQDCMQVLFHDITERKHAEETIQRILDGIAPTTGQEFFSTLVKYLCDVCGVEFAFAGAIDPDHPQEVQTIAGSHRGQPIENFRYDTRGTPCEHVIGKTLCFHPAGVQEKFPQDYMLVEMGIDSYLGIPLWSSNGDALGLIVLLNDRPFPDPAQTQVILQVVAARCGAELERQRAEKRLRENEERMQADLSLRQRDLLHASRLNAIGQMVAGLSHEVAQPLNAISNFAVASARLLDSDTSGAPNALREYVQAIVVQSQRCAAILRRLRDFSRRTPTLKTSCDLNSLLIESVELIASETRRRHARVQLDLAPDLPQISADRVQIQQVVFNLLNNALEAIQDQEIEHRLMMVRSRAETNSVVFEVEDHGSGITPEITQQLFEPFFTTKHDGMGIGLNICETIVRDHAGRIEVESNEYGGATFRVRLPFPHKVESISEQIPGVVQ